MIMLLTVVIFADVTSTVEAAKANVEILCKSTSEAWMKLEWSLNFTHISAIY